MGGKESRSVILTLDHQEAPARRDASRCLFASRTRSLQGKNNQRVKSEGCLVAAAERPLASSTAFVKGFALLPDQAPHPHTSLFSGSQGGDEVKCMGKARLWETQGQGLLLYPVLRVIQEVETKASPGEVPAPGDGHHLIGHT